MTSTRDRSRKKRRTGELSERFTPRFWEEVDGRLSVAKELKRRVDELKVDAGVDSVQKDLLAQRAVFLSVQLETMEIDAATAGRFDAGVYTQMVNALSGLLSKLGLDRSKKEAIDLRAYAGGRV